MTATGTTPPPNTGRSHISQVLAEAAPDPEIDMAKKGVKSGKRAKGAGATPQAKEDFRRRTGKTPDLHVGLIRTFKSVNTHPGAGLSSKAAWMVNDLLEDLFHRIADKSLATMKYAGKSTLKGDHMQAATRSIFSGELMHHADNEGCKAVKRFQGKAGGE